MKKMLTILFVAASFTACSFDDSDLWNKIDDLESRIAQLEKAASSANADILTLHSLVSVLQGNVTVTSVVNNGEGYTIAFSNGETATISSGRDGTNAPVISVKPDTDGVYYWTMDGEWLLVDGKKVKAAGTDGQDAVVPQIRINAESGNWEISTDGGANWEVMGPATTGGSDDYLFSSVDIRESSVVITLSDDTVIEIPLTAAVRFVVNGGNTLTVDFGTTAIFAVEAAGVADHAIVSKPRGWSVVYSAATAKLSVTAPGKPNSHVDSKGEIIILLVSNTGTSVLSKTEVKGVALYTVTFEGSYWEPFVAKNYNGATYSYNVLNGKGLYSYPLWVDATTQLTTEFPAGPANDGYGYDYPWMLSSYNSNDLVTYGYYSNDMYVYNPHNANSTTGGGNNGSDNFLVAFGYSEDGPFSMGDYRPIFKFKDEKARIIKSVYVNSTNYFLSVVTDGNGLSPALAPGDDVALIATGYDRNGNKVGETTMEYANYTMVTDRWTKWDLSALGAVVKVKFNMVGGSDNGYGFSLPAYYAVDDITVALDD